MPRGRSASSARYGLAVHSPPMTDTRPFSPGLEGVLAGETALSKVDGAAGRLTYRGYPIGELVAAAATQRRRAPLDRWWRPDARLAPAPLPAAVLATLRALPRDAVAMDALRTAISAWGADDQG